MVTYSTPVALRLAARVRVTESHPHSTTCPCVSIGSSKGGLYRICSSIHGATNKRMAPKGRRMSMKKTPDRVTIMENM